MQNKIVITGCDNNTEWMLPWFLKNYKKHNDTPIAIFDFGMSEGMLKWCDANFDDVLKSKHNSTNKSWFNKPFAIDTASDRFESVAWVDTDCEIVGDISDIFDYAEDGKLSVSPDLPWLARRPETRWFNTGVVVSKGKPQILRAWVNTCLRLPEVKNPMYGDQDVLCGMLKDDIFVFANIVKLPNIYNVLRLQHEDGTIPANPKIFHWTGPKGKEIIKGKMTS